VLSVYIGDDWTDEMAFGALVGKAITVRVGPPEMASRATYRVDGVGSGAPSPRAPRLRRRPARSGMSIATRLVGAIWLAALVVIGGFTYLQVGEERQRLFEASSGAPPCWEKASRRPRSPPWRGAIGRRSSVFS